MSEDRVVTLADIRALRAKHSPVPARISNGAAHVEVLAYIVTALMRASVRGLISRSAIDQVFDDAETLSLDSERPTDATRVLRDLYEKIAPGLPKGGDDD